MQHAITRLTLFLLTLSIMAHPTVGFAKKVDGIGFPDTLPVENGPVLQLNGAGFLKKYWVKVYGNSLYLQKKAKDGQAVIDADETMAMRLHIIYDNISLKELKEGLRDGFSYSTGRDPERLKPILARSEKFLSWFDRKTKEYDTATFLYIPGQGTHVSINNAYRGLIPGLDFKKALFGIWIGARPANKPLKAALLGND